MLPQSSSEKNVLSNILLQFFLQDPSMQGITYGAAGQSQVTLNSRTDTFACHICGKKIQLVTSLRRHVKMHKGIYPYHCSICNHGCGKQSDLANHMRHHSGERLTCKRCLKEFITQRSFLMHQASCSDFKKRQ